MNTRRGGIVAVALAAGIAIGAAGSAIAASPTAQPSGDIRARMGQMMAGVGLPNGGGMMATGTGAPGASFGPGMMGSLRSTDRNALLEQCAEVHDAMHAAAGPASPSDPS